MQSVYLKLRQIIINWLSWKQTNSFETLKQFEMFFDCLFIKIRLIHVLKQISFWYWHHGTSFMNLFYLEANVMFDFYNDENAWVIRFKSTFKSIKPTFNFKLLNKNNEKLYEWIELESELKKENESSEMKWMDWMKFIQSKEWMDHRHDKDYFVNLWMEYKTAATTLNIALNNMLLNNIFWNEFKCFLNCMHQDEKFTFYKNSLSLFKLTKITLIICVNGIL